MDAPGVEKVAEAAFYTCTSSINSMAFYANSVNYDNVTVSQQTSTVGGEPDNVSGSPPGSQLALESVHESADQRVDRRALIEFIRTRPDWKSPV